MDISEEDSRVLLTVKSFGFGQYYLGADKQSQVQNMIVEEEVVAEESTAVLVDDSDSSKSGSKWYLLLIGLVIIVVAVPLVLNVVKKAKLRKISTSPVDVTPPPFDEEARPYPALTEYLTKNIDKYPADTLKKLLVKQGWSEKVVVQELEFLMKKVKK
jgi:hypothetical protein